MIGPDCKREEKIKFALASYLFLCHNRFQVKVLQDTVTSGLKLKQTPTKWLTPKQTAERLGVSVRTVYEWLRTGKLPGHKIGTHLWRINESDLFGGLK